jgi:calcineurin-like phosphoesterase family protein
MVHWFTSDTHWAHSNIIKYCNRQFKTVEEMNITLITNINKAVGTNDILYHLGDWSFGKVENAIEFREAINCHNIHLILGNHDERNYEKSEFRNLFTKIDRLREINVHGQKITLCHYALKVWNKSHRGAWHLYGHSHGSLPDDLNSLSFDCGVDCFNYRPISFEQARLIISYKNFKSLDHHKAME